MSNWDLYQRMLRTPAKDLHKIKAAIKSRYTVHDSGDFESVLSDWHQDNEGVWLSKEMRKSEEEKEIDQMVKDECNP